MILLLAVLFVAYANGANDNFKGVATLFGSGSCGYRKALALATASTFAGSAIALLAGRDLARSFSGKGLVPDGLATEPRFLVAAAGGAALAVLIFTRLGIPVSTTHSLLGGLLGAGLVADGSQIRVGALLGRFVSPLLLSPLVAVLLVLVLYPAFRSVRLRLGVGKETCLCIGPAVGTVEVRPDGAATLYPGGVALALDALSSCRSRYSGKVLGLSAQQVLDRLHFLSAGAVSLARGLNDTPKIVALLLAAGPTRLSIGWYLCVAAVMALGGLLGARRVAETMSRRITPMNDGQGFSANLATAVLVILASCLGLPVSTTHVSVAAIFGIGLAARQARRRPVVEILAAWVVTLPCAATVAAVLYAVGPLLDRSR